MSVRPGSTWRIQERHYLNSPCMAYAQIRLRSTVAKTCIDTDSTRFDRKKHLLMVYSL